MSFTGFLKKTVTVKRLVGNQGGNPDKFAFSTVGTISADIQPSSPETTQFVEGVAGETFNIFCEKGADIQKNDRVVIDGVDYTVKGMLEFDEGNIPHKEGVIVKGIS